MKREVKIKIQNLADIAFIFLSFLAAIFLRVENFSLLNDEKILMSATISCFATFIAFWSLGLYSNVVRLLTGKILYIILHGAVIGGVVLYILNLLLGGNLPRSIPIIFGIITFITIGGIRFTARNLLRRTLREARAGVIIYGAGEAGMQLLNSLFHDRAYVPIALLDDDPNLHGMSMSGLRVYAPDQLEAVKERTGVKLILLAIANIDSVRRREIVQKMAELDLQIRTIPPMSELVSGNVGINDLRFIQPEDLLGREPVAPILDLFKKNIENKTVMVSGAGGSIGSELCRQILGQHPKSILLYEISEFNLYSIEAELSEIARSLNSETVIIPLLGSVRDRCRLESVLVAFEVQTLYHAAAYKHVPLVEQNVAEGILNNVFGTLTIASAAQEFGVQNFILISTDKAVRPANIMGATKRIAELICQAYSCEPTATVFSMVRFGNVLGSSGSVIPRFRAQLESGGPITLTHKDINRFFMTIPEAAQLVIQAGAMGKGGDVFVLDMGKPVKILDLAKTMVELCGLQPVIVDDLDQFTPERQQIALHFTGLREGEKLYEELLIGSDPSPTTHPRIMTASENYLPLEELTAWLDSLFVACDEADLPRIITLLKQMPLDYEPVGEKIFDLIWDSNTRKKPQK